MTAENTTVYGGNKIWKACAGSLLHIPPPSSTAYYFPSGHVEHSHASMTSLPPAITSTPFIHCRVLHVSFLADADTDEVFAKFRLIPQPPPRPVDEERIQELDGGGDDGGGDRGGVVSFAKVLTPSDANNGGGFSVPRFCADSIFPPLDFEADPPVQTIRVRDIHGNAFEFRHIYRGTPRRHLLTTGWSKFVNSKRLVAGDSVVFIRDKSTEELFVGVRRVVKPAMAVNSVWGPPQGYNNNNIGGSVSAREKAVVEAVERAGRGGVFEVEYYPRPGVAEFVVGADRVERSMRVCWGDGVRVKMATETEDSSRVQWFQGEVLSLQGAHTGSLWRMLEVKWDEQEILKNMNRVSPWQVECSPPTPSIHTTFPPTKKIKYTTTSGMYDGEDEFPLPSIGFSSMMGQLNPLYLNQNPFSAGMQGARQNQLFLSTLPTLPNNNNNTEDTPQIHHEYHDASVSQRDEVVPMDLNVGKTPSNTPSPDSQNSVQLCCPTPTGTKKTGITSFQLFGKTLTIHTEEPVNSVDDVSCTEYDDHGAKAAEETMDHTVEDPYKKVQDNLGSPCQRPPMVG
ncbi:hypothetical protein vseg_019161 [Gypsophila vaccaria]